MNTTQKLPSSPLIGKRQATLLRCSQRNPSAIAETRGQVISWSDTQQTPTSRHKWAVDTAARKLQKQVAMDFVQHSNLPEESARKHNPLVQLDN